ncbi:transglutaminaseTgpA domain-containing protein [Nocardioides sp. SYSU D00038]|uniref:transglutaminaseTgpA domain-containing protein n=1 Tax=Nocardioides sp. SYSU D00038 TaxID=2812554 RepID=UPI001967501F|nr:transglutaminaseTgpA domain-containing protein [Nocardioides sp. SYSU D00038]
MSRSRVSLPGQLLMSVVAMATVWVALLSWRGFTVESDRYLAPAFLLGVLIAVSGALGRWARLPGVVVFLGQAVLGGAVVSWLLTGAPIPYGAHWARLLDVFGDAVDSANRYGSPIPSTVPSVHPLLVAGALGCLLLVDLLACTLRRVPLAGLPLLSIYTVPVSLGGDLHWWVFALTATGFLALLFLHESEQVARWGRPLGEQAGDPEGPNIRAGSVRVSAGRIGGAATALAITLPIFVPTLSTDSFGFGNGSGGDGDISIQNPMADLRRDLRRGFDMPLLRVQTDDPDPTYLRIAVLNRFSANEWSSGDRKVPDDNVADGDVPGLDGITTEVGATYDYEVEALSAFRSTWLPTKPHTTEVVAPGDWRYDPATMDFIAAPDDLDTAGLTWSFRTAALDLTGQDLDSAPSPVGAVDREFVHVPDGIDPMVGELAERVTAESSSMFDKAVALQEWFRDTGGFTYDDSVDLGNGGDALVEFLTEGEGGRTGYCEQFASAMAVMARQLGIPARVAIGFLGPQRLGRQTYEFSAHDLHAWPELYFPGSGWVRFEPTPPNRAGQVPGYTSGAAAPENPPPTSRPSTGGPQAVPSAAPTARLPERVETAGGPADGSDGSSAWLPVVVVVLVGLVLLAGLLGPRLVRRRRREVRVVAGVEAAWRELRDTVLDLGGSWPEARTPQQTREVLVDQLGIPDDEFAPERPQRGRELAPDAVLALDRMVHALELTRYAPDPAGLPRGWRAEVETIEAALVGGAPRRSRRLARWWPRSVFVRPARRVEEPEETRSTDELAPVG